MNSNRELGESLETMLKAIAYSGGISATSVSEATNTDFRAIARLMLELERRGYVYRDSQNAGMVEKHARFRVTEKGRNYLELLERNLPQKHSFPNIKPHLIAVLVGAAGCVIGGIVLHALYSQ